MNPFRSKKARVRLASADYKKLHRRVLERDQWTCQNSGSTTELQVHHIHFRSHLGDDVEENLITLCVGCHARAHEIGRDVRKMA